jgi:hypothetical protein
MGNRERKRLRKGLSIARLPLIECEGIPRANLESAIREAKTLSLTLARNRPGEAAWVYRFSVPDTPVTWVGVRFSEEPERADLTDDGRIIRLAPVIGYRNGQRISPEVCTMVHGLRDYQLAAMRDTLSRTPSGKILMSFPSNDLIDKYRDYFKKNLGRD